ncbi:serine/arginine repetitive matrix protein 1-like [Cygnus olor]|uniref:serine/arginine repetitive matrix protein 1-like n=1 Tax=Cygnus olor TaxID=8869 RepID=UPI001ADDE9BD|nr:serine/arginine repetitive matrix protein 1-like [Cygnus olor]
MQKRTTSSASAADSGPSVYPGPPPSCSFLHTKRQPADEREDRRPRSPREGSAEGKPRRLGAGGERAAPGRTEAGFRGAFNLLAAARCPLAASPASAARRGDARPASPASGGDERAFLPHAADPQPCRFSERRRCRGTHPGALSSQLAAFDSSRRTQSLTAGRRAARLPHKAGRAGRRSCETQKKKKKKSEKSTERGAQRKWPLSQVCTREAERFKSHWRKRWHRKRPRRGSLPRAAGAGSTPRLPAPCCASPGFVPTQRCPAPLVPAVAVTAGVAGPQIKPPTGSPALGQAPSQPRRGAVSDPSAGSPGAEATRQRRRCPRALPRRRDLPQPQPRTPGQDPRAPAGDDRGGRQEPRRRLRAPLSRTPASCPPPPPQLRTTPATSPPPPRP